MKFSGRNSPVQQAICLSHQLGTSRHGPLARDLGVWLCAILWRANLEDVGDELALSNQVCFALYAASRAVTGVYRPILDELSLTYPQYLVLLVLWEKDADVTVKELGEELMLDSGTLSPLLKRMIAAGLVTKERSTTDERSVRIRLTAAGLAMKDRAQGIPARIAGATGLSPVDLAALRTALRRISATAR